MPPAARLGALLVMLVASWNAPTLAFHRSAAAVLPLTVSGDTDLPRLPPQGRRALTLAHDTGAGLEIVAVLPFKTGAEQTVFATAGDHASPSISFSGRIIAWETTEAARLGGFDGRQVVMRRIRSDPVPVSFDPTGTSAHPAVDKAGRAIAFESHGNLGDLDNSGGARQIFIRDKRGFTVQASRGMGASRHVMLGVRGRRIAFESTSDPVTGADTGVSQIFVGRTDALPPPQITHGLGPSRTPIISDDARLVAFASEADLAGDLAATGTSQIFVYDTRSETFARLTDDVGGCTRPAVAKAGRDWRITFVCADTPYFFMLRENARYRIQTSGGVTAAVHPMGVHFALLSTTADLAGGTTPGRRIYLLNLFARPAEPVPGTALWFPVQGISPL